MALVSQVSFPKEHLATEALATPRANAKRRRVAPSSETATRVTWIAAVLARFAQTAPAAEKMPIV